MCLNVIFCLLSVSLGDFAFAQHVRESTVVMVEGQVAPIGVDVQPRFSWLHGVDFVRGVGQARYQVQVAIDSHFSNITYDTGVVQSNASLGIQLPASVVLASDTQYYWRSKWFGCIWYSPSNCSMISDSGWQNSVFRTGLFNPSDWHGALFISCATVGACDYVRRDFQTTLGVNISRATLYMTAGGWIQVEINGNNVAPTTALTPAWSQWNQRLPYMALDVGSMLGAGAPNAIGVTCSPFMQYAISSRISLAHMQAVYSGTGGTATSDTGRFVALHCPSSTQTAATSGLSRIPAMHGRVLLDQSSQMTFTMARATMLVKSSRAGLCQAITRPAGIQSRMRLTQSLKTQLSHGKQ
jgi:hypothetical protein